jgi:hypothetical protein
MALEATKREIGSMERERGRRRAHRAVKRGRGRLGDECRRGGDEWHSGESTRRSAVVSVTTWERKPQQGKEDRVRVPLKWVRVVGTLSLARNVGAGGSCRLDRERGVGGWGRGGSDERASAASDCEREEARQ